MQSLELSLNEYLKEKKYFEGLGLEVIGSREGNSENQNKIYLVRKKR